MPRLSDGFLPVLGQPAASAKPCEGPLDDSSAGKKFKAISLVSSLDNFQRPLAYLFQPTLQHVSRIAAIGKDMQEPRPAMFDRLEKAILSKNGDS